MPRFVVAALVVAPFLTAAPAGAEVPPFILPPVAVSVPVVVPVVGEANRRGWLTNGRSGVDYDESGYIEEGTIDYED